jgi:hypothetical protein
MEKIRHYTIIDPLYMAFYSRDLYRGIARSWSTGICLLYMLSLVALCWIPGMIRLDTDITHYIDNEIPKFESQMPEITISKGEASIAEQQPYIIKDPESGDPVVIIDTTGKTKSLSGSKATALLTKNQLLIRSGSNERPMFNLSDFDDIKIDRTTFHSWLEAFTEWFALLIYPFAVILEFLYRMVQVLIYAVVGAIFSRFVDTGLNYRMLFKVCTVAMTPLIMLNMLAYFFRIEVPFPFFVNSAIATGYLIFAIRSGFTGSPQE